MSQTEETEESWHTLEKWLSRGSFDQATQRRNRNLLNRVRLAVDLVNFVSIINIEKHYLLKTLTTKTIVVQQEENGNFRLKTHITEEAIKNHHLNTTTINQDSQSIGKIILNLVLPELGQFLKCDTTLWRSQGKRVQELKIEELSQKESLQNIYNNIQYFCKTFCKV